MRNVASWAELEAAAAEIAASGRRLLYRNGSGDALLATVRADQPPRIHPITIGIVGGDLLAFILRSAKLTDLADDGRYALHAHVDPAAPSEFLVRGRAREVTDPAIRAPIAAGWAFEADESYRLFAFGIETALFGRRDGPDDWPPIYARWTEG
jgi:hypothetical protein